MKIPQAKKIPTKITQHNSTRFDNYAWLRDKNWKKFIQGNLDFNDSEILNYLKDENAYTNAQLEGEKKRQDTLYQEILSRIKEDDQSFPEQRFEYNYYSREEKGKDYSISCRKKNIPNAVEEIYFDKNVESKNEKLYLFGPSTTSQDNHYFAYFYNLTGSMERTLKVRDLTTGKDLDWSIDRCTGSFEWIDNQNLYYVERDQFSRGKRIYKLDILKGPTFKELIFEKPAEFNDLFLSLTSTNDRNYFIIYLNSDSTQVIYLSKKNEDKFQFFIKGEDDITFELDHYNDHFYILTNLDQANDFKIVKTKTTSEYWPSKHWQEVIAETKDQCIGDIEIYQHYLVVTQKNNTLALDQLYIYNLKTQEKKLITFPYSLYSLFFRGAWDFNSKSVIFDLETPLHPYCVYQLDLESGNFEEVYKKTVPNFDSNNYILERKMATSRDGVEIPLSIIYKKDLVLNGENKALIYGYGSYGYDMPAEFNSSLFSLVDRGFIYCTAHIRGGSDKGNDWYLDGKMKKKMNTFNDFIDSCQYLIRENYTQKKLIAIEGKSAGGLLIGAVTNMAPDLFGCVIAEMPFVDVINTISDPSLPLTPPEWEEWGNPIKSKIDFDYMMKYSPYDNVCSQDYPPMLYNSAISDEQVTYWEPAKMVAKLRELKTDDNLLLLNMKMNAGHSGASKRYEWIKDKAFNYSFLLKALDK